MNHQLCLFAFKAVGPWEKSRMCIWCRKPKEMLFVEECYPCYLYCKHFCCCSTQVYCSKHCWFRFGESLQFFSFFSYQNCFEQCFWMSARSFPSFEHCSSLEGVLHSCLASLAFHKDKVMSLPLTHHLRQNVEVFTDSFLLEGFTINVKVIYPWKNKEGNEMLNSGFGIPLNLSVNKLWSKIWIILCQTLIQQWTLFLMKGMWLLEVFLKLECVQLLVKYVLIWPKWWKMSFLQKYAAGLRGNIQ